MMSGLLVAVFYCLGHNQRKQAKIERVLGTRFSKRLKDVEVSYHKYPGYPVVVVEARAAMSKSEWDSLVIALDLKTGRTECGQMPEKREDPDSGRWWNVPAVIEQQYVACKQAEGNNFQCLWFSNYLYFKFDGQPPVKR
jgi:hypothetical protein